MSPSHFKMPPEYQTLAAVRARSSFAQPEAFGYDFRDWVSPYTKGAHCLHGIAIVLQDWASAEWLRKVHRPEVQELGRDPTLRTNTRLEALLRKVLGIGLSEVYATNAFPFVKPGGMSAPLAQSVVDATVAEYTAHELRIASPRLVLAFGKLAANALQKSGIHHVNLPHPAARIGALAAHEREWRNRLDMAAVSVAPSYGLVENDA